MLKLRLGMAPAVDSPAGGETGRSFPVQVSRYRLKLSRPSFSISAKSLSFWTGLTT